jgi:hypothetical protein
MHTFLEILRPILALVVGATIGFAFGRMQNFARQQHQKMVDTGEFKSPWRIMPGSGGRVALLLVALVLIQIVCPMLFADGTQWWVSGGLLAGYGWTLFLQLRHRRATCI